MKTTASTHTGGGGFEVGAMMEFHLTGKIIPYVRMTQRGKWVNKRAQAYLANQEQLAKQFREQCPEMLPDRTPLSVAIEITTPTPNRGDCDNLAKSVIDSMQGIVFRNDCWIQELYIRRQRGKEHRAKVIVEVM